MANRTRTLLVLQLLTAGVAVAQLAPGYVDPEPILQAAAKAIGSDKLKCVAIAGTGYTGAVGQQKESAWNVDWPRGEALTNYTRTIDWEARSSQEEFDRKPGLAPASWKYGTGWKGGTPLQQHSRQLFAVAGKQGWHRDGPNGQPVAAPPDDAERWQLDLWMNPHGFLKAARLPGANPKAVWRWELGESGRDGHTTIPEKMTVVSIALLGKYRVDATINKENLIQRIHTWVPDPVLGDMNYEHEFTNESYIDIGNGIRFPTVWHHHDGWDDNFGALNTTAGHNGFGGDFKNITANACSTPLLVPRSVSQSTFPIKVGTQKLADGVYLLGGGSHNSVAVEFKNYIAVVEAPLDERRSLAVIEEIVKLIPNKPIRFLVNTHQHFDHIGGLRTYMHIGATIITHWKNFSFYNRDVLNYAPRTLDPDMMSLWPPTEVAEGYQYETVRENYALSDGTRTMQISYVQPLAHAEGMLMAYLPKEKIVIEADLYDPSLGLTTATPANRTFYNHVLRLGIDVETIAPIHGRPVPWSDFTAMLLRAQIADSPRLLQPTPLRLKPPSPDWTTDYVSSVAAGPNGMTYVLHRNAKVDPVIAIDRNGRIVNSWGRGLYTNPHSIRIGPDGGIWTVDSGNSTVLKFSPSGQQLLRIQVDGLPGASDIAFGPHGELFIADGYGNARVLKYDSKGQRMKEWGSKGTGPGQFNLVHAIAAHDGIVYVADRQNGRIQRFDLDGKYLGEWTHLGKTFSISIEPGGNLWIGTHPRNVSNESPGWLVNVDRTTGKVLGHVDSPGLHSIDATVPGAVLSDPGRGNLNQVLWFRR